MNDSDSQHTDIVDFSDRKVQEWILRHDKQTRLEGLCVEYIFKRLLIEPHFNKDRISTDWWFIAKDSSFLPVKLIRNPNLNKIDRKLVNTFINNGVDPAFVCYQTAHQRFLVGTGKHVFHNGDLDLGEFRKLKKRGPDPKPKIDSVRQTRAIDFLRQRELVRDAAVQRYAANWLFSGRKLWDLDCFVLYRNDIVGFEVKQKFPTRSGTFGLNIGLKRLFEWLEHMNIRIFHVVLSKPVWHEDFPSLEYLENKRFWEHEVWLAVKPNKLLDYSTKIGVAPAKTSIHKTNKLRFYHFPVSAFSILGSFIDAGEMIPHLLAGKVLEGASLDRIPRLSIQEANALYTVLK